MKRTWIIVAAMACFLLYGCQAFEKKQQSGAAVELNGHYLYRSTLDSLTLGMNSEDSLRAAQQYIRQWAQDILLYDATMSHTNAQIETMVEDYRRTLYAQAYEERLVDKRMSKTITDSTVLALYQQMPERFKLDESIMKGMLVVVPSDAPNIQKLRQWMAAQSLDKIEKYAYQNASGYELFTEQWKTTTEIIRLVPMERADLENRLKGTNHIEVADSSKIYLLQITDKNMRGEAMPVEYARPQIEQIILNARRVEFMRKERERLYNEAIQERKIHFYE
ncbi:MAG: hypothetical protein IKP11_05455 [Paludibacteraceae bacterium]|nr:hypothetical protein [Paludibacteraceae bacterium]